VSTGIFSAVIKESFPMNAFVSPGVVLSLCALGLHAAAVPSAPQMVQRLVLPSNIQADGQLRQAIELLLGRSRTLRKQCARIGAASRVRVWITIEPHVTNAETRARSTVRRFDSGLLDVEIELPPASTDFVELLAHELEHVTEFIDGIDLRALARNRDRHVVERRSDGAIESDRAHAAGRAAAAEAPIGGDPAARAVGRGVTTAVRAAWRGVRSVF
jgi:hypothetical protein